MLKTRITEQYGLRVPFINAGIAFIATAPLVRAVCKAGGMGMLGAAAMPPPRRAASGHCQIVVATGAHWASDHLSMTSVPGRAIGNLTPLPLDHEMADYLVQKCRQAARVFPVPFLLENISVLFRPAPDEMTEQMISG
jgi:uncharacterized protein (UPF0276 family)